MKEKRSQGRSPKCIPLSLRAPITFPRLYETLEQIAQQKKVSLAWLVRDAAEKYVASEVKQGSEGGRL